ncbi:hybrid sensor histidine kinase/response regulator [Ideonella sp. DXS22W]|uniref:histidine kinase n=1 Tax=Pseudaquabacterium inlustre TaxID=2984192 RepID=A0ABU9CCT7_9BURK
MLRRTIGHLATREWGAAAAAIGEDAAMRPCPAPVRGQPPAAAPGRVVGWAVGGRAWALAALLTLPLAALASGTAAAGPAADGSLRLNQAEVMALDSPGPGHPVVLPDDWHQRGAARPGSARYRLTTTLPATAAPGAWALWSAQWPLHHRLTLNGEVVSDTLDTHEGLQPRPGPRAVAWPASAQRPGRSNEIVLDMHSGLQAGLGELWVGPQAAIEARALAHRRLTVELPRLLNMLAAGSCLFMGVLWARKRDERALGWFALLGGLMSLRNAMVLDPAGHAPVGWSLVTYLGVVAMAALLGGFAQAVTPRPRRWFPPLLGAVCLFSALNGLVAGTDPAALDQARRWGYALLFPVELLSMGLIVGHLRTLPRVQGLAVGATLAATLLAGVHDWLLHRGELPITGLFWMPWTVPAMVLAFGAVLAARLVAALRAMQDSHRRLEQRVAERTAALEAANAAKTRFLAAASHDLRQPLVTIGLLLGVLRDQLTVPAQQRLAAQLDESVGTMEGLLRGLLDLSRLEAGRTVVDWQPVALAPLLRALVDEARTQAERRGLRLRLRVPPGATVRADAVLLEQIVRNLLGNALRYTMQGGVLLAVRRRGTQWWLAVHDTGPGIAPELQASVFEEFVQGGNPHRDPQQGLGLGLAIVRRAATLMGTDVTLRSQPGRGSGFGVALAAADPAPARTTSAGTTAAPALPAPLPPGTRVWVVEDDATVRQALTERLAAWGAQVTPLAQAAAVSQALTGLAATPGRQPQLLITDLRLPDADGLAVARAVAAACGALPTLLITGNTAPAELDRLSDSGLAVLHKPFRDAALREALAALTSHPPAMRPAG